MESRSRTAAFLHAERVLPTRCCQSLFYKADAQRPGSAAGYGTPILSITFGPIVGNAEHLAVLGRTFAALAPCGNVVGVHFVELIDSALVRIVPNRAERTIGLAFGCLRLLSVSDTLYLRVAYVIQRQRLLWPMSRERWSPRQWRFNL